MDSEKSEQKLINEFKRGNRDAADRLIAKYFDRVAKAAEKKLAQRNMRVSGGEDVAVSVFDSLWNRANEKRFSDDELASPDELWRLLSRMISFKAEDHARKASARKRGGGQVRGDSIFVRLDRPGGGFHSIQASELTPVETAELRESYTLLMKKLDDEVLQKVAVMRIEGFGVAEIAARFDRSERFVKRKLAMIRKIWQEQIDLQAGQTGARRNSPEKFNHE